MSLRKRCLCSLSNIQGMGTSERSVTYVFRLFCYLCLGTFSINQTEDVPRAAFLAAFPSWHRNAVMIHRGGWQFDEFAVRLAEPISVCRIPKRNFDPRSPEHSSKV